MDEPSPVVANSPWREPQIIGLLAIVLIAYFLRLDTVSVRGEESRWFGIAQEMVRTGDWIVPRLQGEAFHSRPPLQSWAMAVSLVLHGGASPWSVRLPGVLAVFLTCLLLYVHARRFLGPLGAFSAAAAFATMVQLLEIGRLAETESLFSFFICAALLTWHRGITSGWPDWRTWMCAYAIAGLAALTKGTQAPVYLGTTSAVYLFWTGEWRRFFSMGHVLGLLTFSLVFGSWFAAYSWQLGWEFAWKTLMNDTAGCFFDTSRWATYLRHLLIYPCWVFTCMMPWSIFLFGYVRRDLRTQLGAALTLVQFTAIACIVAFPTCWLVPNANARYWIPLYPCVALLVGVVLERGMLADQGSVLRRRLVWMRTAVGILLVASPLLVVFARSLPFSFRPLDAQPMGHLSLFLAAVLVAGVLNLAYRRAASAIPTFACAIVLALFGSILNPNITVKASLDVETPMIALKERLPDDVPFYSLGPMQHRFAFFLDRPIQLVGEPASNSVHPPVGSYFCVTVNDPDKASLPFAWEKLDVVCMDRYPAQRHSFVIVGRRVAP